MVETVNRLVAPGPVFASGSTGTITAFDLAPAIVLFFRESGFEPYTKVG
jgi:hypothetical protein